MDMVFANEFGFSTSLLRFAKAGRLREAFIENEMALADFVFGITFDVGSKWRPYLAVLDPLLQPFLKENATINDMASLLVHHAKMESVSAGSIESEVSKVRERFRGERLNWRVGYNPLGKLMTLTSIDSWPGYYYRVHDADGLSRLVALQVEAKLLRRIPDAEVARFLATVDQQLFDPYTGKPMQWDAEARQMWFKPADVRALRDRIGGREGRLAVGL